MKESRAVKILLIGGGTGGHITPLLAVARELKQLLPEAELIGVCEKRGKFADLFLSEPTITRVYQIRAGKYRRYGGQSRLSGLFDVKTLLLNIRDFFRTAAGCIEARRLLKQLQPDIMVVKGGFVAVPMGLMAARQKIPFITHDSDSTPGLANRIIGRWAAVHATGMPKELYKYPADRTVYTGIPVADKFKKVSPRLRTAYRDSLNLGAAEKIITVVGGSQGAGQLNEDIAAILPRLMQKHRGLGLVHVAGEMHEKQLARRYDGELLADERRRVVVKGFTSEIDVCQGAADIVVSRAGATQMAELSLQGLPVVIVPGRLAGGHQDHNAEYFAKKEAALVVPYGDTEGLYQALNHLLDDVSTRKRLGDNLNKLAKPRAARELAEVAADTIRKG